MELRNKSILLTGAARGLGRELAVLLDREGCLLFLMDRDGEGLSLLARELTCEHRVVPCDLGDLPQRKKLIQTIKERSNIDILVNCAGVGSHSLLSQLTVDEIERVLQVNSLAPLELIAGLSPLELIVNIGSVAGEMNLPSMSLYSASKASIHAFTRSMQLEGARTLLVILGPLRGTEFVRSIEHPRTGQPKWYRDLDLDVKVAARGIIRAMKAGNDQIVLPHWYRIVFVVMDLFLPLMKRFRHQFYLNG
jgi:short-subunit dehydrogenase